MTSYPDTAELNQIKKGGQSQDQYHEHHEINVTALVLPCVIAVVVPHVPKYRWLSFTGSLKSSATGNCSFLKKPL